MCRHQVSCMTHRSLMVVLCETPCTDWGMGNSGFNGVIIICLKWSSTSLITWALELAHMCTILLYFLFERTRCERSSDAQGMSDDNRARPMKPWRLPKTAWLYTYLHHCAANMSRCKSLSNMIFNSALLFAWGLLCPVPSDPPILNCLNKREVQHNLEASVFGAKPAVR